MMKIIIPNLEGLPKEHYLNSTIDAVNSGGLIDEVFTASTIAGFSRFLAEHPEIASGQDWINRAGQLVHGIEVSQATVEGMYEDLIKLKKTELRQDGAEFGSNRKLMFYFLALIMLALSGMLLYKIYIAYKSTG